MDLVAAALAAVVVPVVAEAAAGLLRPRAVHRLRADRRLLARFWIGRNLISSSAATSSSIGCIRS